MFSKDWLASLHLLPVEASLVTAFVIYLLLPNCVYLSLLFLLVGLLCTLLLLVFLPLAPLKSSGPYHVGIRHITRDIAVYYPTTVKPIEGEPWLPGNEARYIRAMAAQAGMRDLWLKHLRLVRIPCTRNANVVSLMTHEAEPRHTFILSHTLKAHHLFYSRLAMALASRGAIVFSILHADSSENNSNVKTHNHSNENETLLSDTKNAEQLNRRVNDVVSVINGIVSGDLLLRLHARSDDQLAFTSSKPKVHLIGHGLGAATMLIVALKDPNASVHVSSITALDTSSVRVLGDVSNTKLPSSVTSHLAVQIVDSEEWSNRMDHCLQIEELRQSLTALGVACVRKIHTGTDHMSVTDMGLLTPMTRRKKFASKKSSIFIPLVAREIIQFAQSTEEGIVSDMIV